MLDRRAGDPAAVSFALALTLVTGLGAAACTRTGSGHDPGASAAISAAGTSGPTGALRLSGTVEAVRSRTVAVPRLAGTVTPLVITTLVPAGTRVEPGDVLVRFDPQQQVQLALDKRAELVDLQSQIDKKRADQSAAEAKDTTELAAAEHDVDRAKLDVLKNEFVSRVDGEKNSLALEQAQARYDQLKKTYDLKRQAAAADLKILEIRRDRSEQALRHAEDNARLMEIRAPFAGLVVIKTMYRSGSGFVEIMEGDEVRPGLPIVDIVDTSVMQVRARVNQADGGLVHEGQKVTIGLDGFPALHFPGTIESVTPLATTSALSTTVRSFTAVVAVQGNDPQLLPDLTAWVEVPSDAATAAAVPAAAAPASSSGSH